MPTQNPGSSFQGYETPDELIRAIKHRLGIQEFIIDLAAADEAVAKSFNYYTPAHNSLLQRWGHTPGWQWLNPPFSDLGAWTSKAMAAEGRVAMLVPASIGSNWWRDHVHGVARVLALCGGRVTFVGQIDPYPKDLALLLYHDPLEAPAYEMWNWRRELAA